MDLKTPRDIPENIEDWSPEIEDLLSEWGEVALCFQYLHSFSQRKYKKKYHHFQIPIIVLSTLTGTANFATDSYVPQDFKQGFSAGVGSLNLLCGILGTLLSFLRYSEVYEGHRISALAWAKLSRNIEIELLYFTKLQELSWCALGDGFDIQDSDAELTLILLGHDTRTRDFIDEG